MFAAFQRTSALARFVSQKTAVVQDYRSLFSKPPKDKIGPVESLFTLSVFGVALLGPAGWILHHIPAYRQRAPPEP